jgi:hypothetical protein
MRRIDKGKFETILLVPPQNRKSRNLLMHVRNRNCMYGPSLRVFLDCLADAQKHVVCVLTVWYGDDIGGTFPKGPPSSGLTKFIHSSNQETRLR